MEEQSRRFGAVIWDVGGTLVRRRLSDQQVLREALLTTGLRPAPLSHEEIRLLSQQGAQARRNCRTHDEERRGFMTMARGVLGGNSAPESDVLALGKRLSQYFDTYEVIAGARELLEAVDLRGVAQAVLSQWPPSLDAFLEHHQLRRYFKVMVCTSEEGLLKPDPVLIVRTLERLGVRPTQAIYVGDHLENDIIPAKSLGLTAIHVSHESNPEAEVHGVAELKRRLEALLS